MNVSRVSWSLVDEWQRSSDARRAAILRLGYTLLFFATLPYWVGAFPELRPIIRQFFTPVGLVLFQSSVVPLIANNLSAQAQPSKESGSPNGRYIRTFLTSIYRWKDDQNWKRPFYRFCIYFIVAVGWIFGTFLAVFFAPLLALECIIWIREQ
ncbi:MAG: hypothetical protein WCK51_04975 [Armatimonadota bacterium]